MKRVTQSPAAFAARGIGTPAQKEKKISRRSEEKPNGRLLYISTKMTRFQSVF